MSETEIVNREVAELQEELKRKKLELEKLSQNLEKQTAEMNQFTYIVSHDLQAPLRMVTGFLELLEKKYGDKLDESAKQYIDYSVKGSVKMKRLIFDLLEYSRLNTIEHETEDVDLNEILDNVKPKLVKQIEESGATIEYAALPVVSGYKKQIEQLLQHLLDNALKFRNGQKPVISISTREEENRWEIGIRDNGIGIDPAFADKIFQVFRRLHTDESVYKGTGIGLAICKKIIDIHQGKIWVKSAKNEGSTFIFSLPKN